MLKRYSFENIEIFDEGFVVGQKNVEFGYIALDYLSISTGVGII